MSEVVLVAEDLVRSFESTGGTKVLNKANLSIQAGQAVAVTGVSGCGKSTLLHILGGLAKPDSGKVTIKGQNLTELSKSKLGSLRNKELGFVYQMHHLIGELSIEENVALPLLVAGLKWKEAIERANELLTQVGLGEHSKKSPSQLSGGERQRTAIARAIANKPSCVIADEPTGNLDYHTAKNVINILLDACKNYNCSLLVATHDLELASKLNKHYEMRNGRLYETKST